MCLIQFVTHKILSKNFQNTKKNFGNQQFSCKTRRVRDKDTHTRPIFDKPLINVVTLVNRPRYIVKSWKLRDVRWTDFRCFWAAHCSDMRFTWVVFMKPRDSYVCVLVVGILPGVILIITWLERIQNLNMKNRGNMLQKGEKYDTFCKWISRNDAW